MPPLASVLTPADVDQQLSSARHLDPHLADVLAERGDLVAPLGLRYAGPRRIQLRWELLGLEGPVVVVLGGISAGRHVATSGSFAEPGWWDTQVGVDLAIDPRACRVISIDWVGSDGSLDLPIDTADQADAVITVADHLGLPVLDAVVGCSYGGQVALQLAVRHRRRVRRLVLISAAARPNPYAAAYRALQREVVALGEETGRAAESLIIARQLGMLSYRSPAEFRQRFPGPTALVGGRARCAPQDYLDACGRRYVERWSTTAFRRLSESIDLHAVDPSAVRIPSTLAAVVGDWLASPAEVRALADGIAAPTSLHLIESIFGHDAFLKEAVDIASIVRAGLAGLDWTVTS